MVRNDLLTLRADTLGADLEGVCRYDGMAVFVPGLLPGEEALTRIVKVEKRFAFGKVESLSSAPSPERRTPDCPVYPRCGGCSARHMSYAATLEAKRQHVQDCFARIAHIPLEVPPVLGMENPHACRNKTALPAGGTLEEPLLGFFAPRSHRLIPVLDCPNAMEPTARIAQAIQFWMKEARISPYQEASHTGLLRHAVIRVNRLHEAMVTLVAASQQVPRLSDLIRLLSDLRVTSLYLNINSRQTNVIFGDRFDLLYGKETLSDTLCGLRFELSPASFFQVNPFQTEVLYATALDFASLQPTDTLCDVYCGAGTISLMMARHCRRVTGIEIVPSAVADAKENARRNGISNASFHEGKAETLLPRMVQDGLRPHVMVVDPPRKGLEASVIQAMAQAVPDRIVYVSCNPATQARDAALLRDRGYHIQKIQPVDMFPYTSHVETVVQLSQQKPDHYVRVGLDLDQMDVSPAESKASYQEIKDYVLEHTGLNVSCLYIAQVKAKHGIIERDCYNRPKAGNSKVPRCPPVKEKAIEDALRHFQMIDKEETCM